MGTFLKSFDIKLAGLVAPAANGQPPGNQAIWRRRPVLRGSEMIKKLTFSGVLPSSKLVSGKQPQLEMVPPIRPIWR